MELNSSCREKLYGDTCVIDSKVVLYLVGIMSIYWLSAIGWLAVLWTV